MELRNPGEEARKLCEEIVERQKNLNPNSKHHSEAQTNPDQTPELLEQWRQSCLSGEGDFIFGRALLTPRFTPNPGSRPGMDRMVEKR